MEEIRPTALLRGKRASGSQVKHGVLWAQSPTGVSLLALDRNTLRYCRLHQRMIPSCGPGSGRLPRPSGGMNATGFMSGYDERAGA